jgi:UDP-GlcNAc3NAcA epimerase
MSGGSPRPKQIALLCPMISILTIVGARPQFIKASAVSRAVRDHFGGQVREYMLHTGQHYDENMSQVFFEQMQIPQPDFRLNVGSGSHARQTGDMMKQIEEILLTHRFDALLVYGDTNSTLAGALAAAKLHIPVIHVEAGLRSFNKSMPEEINRICTDHVSTFLFPPTEAGVKNLEKEGIRFDAQRAASPDNPLVKNVGDVMYDNSLFFAGLAETQSTITQTLGVQDKPFVLCTIHRDFNTDNPQRLNALFKGLNAIAETGTEVILPCHPRTEKKLESLTEKPHNRVRITEPVSFFDMIKLEKHALQIITDSGGVQKEAYFYRKPCIVLRPETEWVEILHTGNGILADADPEKITEAFHRFAGRRTADYPTLYGNGQAARQILEEVLNVLENPGNA